MPRSAARVLSLLAALTLGLLGVAVEPTSAYACTCGGTSSGSLSRQADAVFSGRVLSSASVRKPKPGRVDVRFEVSRVYKGTVYREQVVASPRDGCGFAPDVGTTWVIFAEEAVLGNGDAAVLRLVTRLCSGNLSGSVAPVSLGTGRAPAEGASDRGERAAATDLAFNRALKIGGVTLVALAVLVGAGLAVLWRPGRAAR
ncbi:MAG TPA: hypothetical protein VEQ66_05160 [Propionibacteriaceae bacterium]|nr:hypothetical protein [Propionibacteriaceae bacterium]